MKPNGPGLLAALLIGSASIMPGFSAESISDMISASSLMKAKKGGLGLPTPPELGPKVPNDAPINENQYLLGPGDQLAIFLGATEKFQVSPEGFLLIPGIPPVKVTGKSLAESKVLVKKALARQYDTAKVHIALGGINQFKAAILGEVVNPGAKTVNSFTRLAEALSLAGGFTRYAIRDRITVIHPAGDSISVDLARFFRAHGEDDNPYLNIGDKVVVGAVDFAKPHCTVKSTEGVFFHQIEGSVSLKDLYGQISNFTYTAPPTRCRVIHPDGKESMLDPQRTVAYLPRPGDTIEFVKDKDYVFVGGAVARPHVYEYVPNFGADDYLYLAGVMPISADSRKYYVVRDNRRLEADAVNRGGVRPGDKIYLNRNRIESSRDYLTIFVSLASIVIGSATLYYTAQTASK